jgi:hypothetical protein
MEDYFEDKPMSYIREMTPAPLARQRVGSASRRPHFYRCTGF